MGNISEPLLDAELLKDDLGYFDESNDMVKDMILGAQFFLANAGAFREDNPMTKVVVRLMVGHWLENRDQMNYDYRDLGQFPASMQAMITSLQYWVVEQS